MITSALFHVGDRSDARWNPQSHNVGRWPWLGVKSRVAIMLSFRFFHGVLSSTEATVALMHAMTSDPGAILVYMRTLFRGTEESLFSQLASVGASKEALPSSSMRAIVHKAQLTTSI